MKKGEVKAGRKTCVCLEKENTFTESKHTLTHRKREHTHTVSPFCIIMAANNKVIYSVGLMCDRTAPASWHLRQTNDREVTSQNNPGFLFLTLDQLNFIHQIA